MKDMMASHFPPFPDNCPECDGRIPGRPECRRCKGSGVVVRDPTPQEIICFMSQQIMDLWGAVERLEDLLAVEDEEWD